MAARDGIVFQSSVAERVPGLLDGGSARLIDRPGTVEALEELIGLGVHSVALLPEAPFSPEEAGQRAGSPERADAMRALAEAGPLLGPYRAAVAGAGSDDEGRLGLVVFNHETEAEAEVNLDRLRTVMSEGRPVDRGGQSWGDLFDDWAVELNSHNVVLRYRKNLQFNLTHPLIQFYLAHDSLFWTDQ